MYFSPLFFLCTQKNRKAHTEQRQGTCRPAHTQVMYLPCRIPEIYLLPLIHTHISSSHLCWCFCPHPSLSTQPASQTAHPGPHSYSPQLCGWLTLEQRGQIRDRQAGRRSRYSSYVGMPAWPNKLGETIHSKGELQASPAWVARSVKLPKLSGLWPVSMLGGWLQAYGFAHKYTKADIRTPHSHMATPSFPWHLFLATCCMSVVHAVLIFDLVLF